MNSNNSPRTPEIPYITRARKLLGSHELFPVTDFAAEEEKSNTYVELGSQSMLEEDVAQMGFGDTKFAKEVHKLVFSIGHKKFVKSIGRYLPETLVNYFYPELDLATVDGYDFNSSMVRVFALNAEDFENVFSTLHPDESHKGVSGFTKMTIVRKASHGYIVDLSEYKLIFLKEIGNTFPDNFRQKDLLLDDLRERFIHELLHVFNVGNNLPTNLMEAVVEWYAQRIAYDMQISHRNLPELEERPTGYKNGTYAVAILAAVLVEGGIQIETLDKALLQGDIESLQKIEAFLNARYGQENTTKILRWEFKDQLEFLKFVHNLEITKNSNTARTISSFSFSNP